MWRSFLKHVVPERIPWFGVPLYSRIASFAVEPYYRPIARDIATVLQRGRILDIGSGPGYLPVEIASAGPDLTIDGIDLSRTMIRSARRLAHEAGVANRVTFMVGDGNRLGFPDRSYDMVLSTGALHAWRDPVRVLNECHRVLKNGGEAWIYDPAHVMTEEARELLQKGLTGIDRLAFAWVSFTSKASTPLSEEEIRAIIRKSKFASGNVHHTDWFKITLKRVT